VHCALPTAAPPGLSRGAWTHKESALAQQHLRTGPESTMQHCILVDCQLQQLHPGQFPQRPPLRRPGRNPAAYHQICQAAPIDNNRLLLQTNNAGPLTSPMCTTANVEYISSRMLESMPVGPILSTSSGWTGVIDVFLLQAMQPTLAADASQAPASPDFPATMCTRSRQDQTSPKACEGVDDLVHVSTCQSPNPASDTLTRI
jgi:hypothetical protein